MNLALACQQCIEAGKTQQLVWQHLNWLCMPINANAKRMYLLGVQTKLMPAQLLKRLEAWQFANVHSAYIQQQLYAYYVIKQATINDIENAIGLLKQLV